ncbi:MAG: N-acetylglucosaminyldiphosphoundecaprenol N-acetyl-beta-D-mannosaminyltransferase [Ascidiaceihabitans sp.]|jgi:N-acetylglucosaminyldiphosphoundecaprenol N-acetyl-beta-D-mannosaminyltransferase
MKSDAYSCVDHIRVGGVSTAPLTSVDLLSLMEIDIGKRASGTLARTVSVFDTNGQGLSLYHLNPTYAAAMEQADIVHADGQFIVWASRLNGQGPIPERTATTDFIHDAAKLAAQKGYGFYLLGSSEDINARCAATLMEEYPNLRIVGRRNGYFDREDEAEICVDIAASGADIVWVGLGKPKEQEFVIRNREALGAAWAVTCGGCFHFVVGDYSRAPVWMQKAGLEWVHRMVTGPRYLLRRYLTTIPHVIWIVLRHDIFGRKKEDPHV